MKKQVFDIRPFPAKTLRWWFNRKNDIDFSPPYQRAGNKWTKSQKVYLIDSLLNGFDIPKLYFVDFTFYESDLNQARKQYAIIDGKQRLNAIFDFFADDLVLNDEIFIHSDPAINLNGYNFSKLKKDYPELAERFENSDLTIISVITNDQSLVNQLFVRLNSGSPLRGSERRTAIESEINNIINHAATSEFFKLSSNFNDPSFVRNELAKFLLFEYLGGLDSTKKVDLDRFVEDKLSVSEPVSYQNLKEIITKVLRLMSEDFAQAPVLYNQRANLSLIYWFYRTNKLLERPLVAEFLALFFSIFSDRSTLVNFPQIFSQAIENNLNEFSKLTRSNNDKGSLISRFNILFFHYKEFLAQIDKELSV